MPGEQLGPYEQARLARIERNKRKLAELGIHSPVPEPPSKPPSKRPPKPRTPARTAVRTTRRSAGQDAPAEPQALAEVTPPESALQPAAPGGGGPSWERELGPEDRRIYFGLIEWKRARAKAKGYRNPFVVCHNRSLYELARARPASLSELGGLWGLSSERVRLHGASMLAAYSQLAEAGLPVSEAQLQPEERPAFEALREWKRARGRELGYNNPCVVAHNRTLVQMVRCKVRTLDQLRGVWGISDRRLAQHGTLMLEALKPHLGPQQPPGHSRGDGRAHPHWLAQSAGLPLGRWEARRTYCFSEFGCRACERHGPEAGWAVQSQQLLNKLRAAYGSWDRCEASGWRWFAAPNHGQGSHNHRWWPPLSICERLGLCQMPMGTRAVLRLLPDMLGPGDQPGEATAES